MGAGRNGGSDWPPRFPQVCGRSAWMVMVFAHKNMVLFLSLKYISSDFLWMSANSLLFKVTRSLSLSKAGVHSGTAPLIIDFYPAAGIR